MTKKVALRFAGFGYEWNEVKLGEVTDIKTGGRDVQDSVEDGLYPFYIRSEEVKRINSYSFDGEAILIPGEGRLGEIFHYANGKFDVHQRVYRISNFTDVNAKFILQQMKKDFKRHAMRNTVKATVDSLRLPTIQSFTLFVPSLPEQTAIGSFFQDIDQLISLQQRKLEVFKEQKKTYLKLLFPAKGQTKPALRFAGFEDEWTSVLLGDISELYQPKTISSEDLLTEGFPVFGANGYIGYYKDYNHKENQVTISARGEGTGTPSFVEGPVWITGNSMVVNVKKQDNITKPFLYAFCLSFDFKPFVTGGAQPQLTREVLKKVNIMLPSLPEQEAIGSFFQDLDKAIAKQEEKVNQLKERKQTLLRKMFI